MSKSDSMIKLRIEFKEVDVKKIFEIIRTISKKFKIWKYGEIIYLFLNVKSISELNKIEMKFKSSGISFSYSKIEYSSGWWVDWKRN